eukprot:GHVR01011497.1.p1 GENE.GHVR01011497.1~~GHVR01011497.1.p1  ORF type:complete len:187 (-),score=51.73 GHVR01011497.1:466-996(-)
MLDVESVCRDDAGDLDIEGRDDAGDIDIEGVTEALGKMNIEQEDDETEIIDYRLGRLTLGFIPGDTEAWVKVLTFDISRYHYYQETMEFQTPITEYEAYVKISEYLEQQMTEEHYNRIKCDLENGERPPYDYAVQLYPRFGDVISSNPVVYRWWSEGEEDEIMAVQLKASYDDDDS